jgi:hypothetical protein
VELPFLFQPCHSLLLPMQFLFLFISALDVYFALYEMWDKADDSRGWWTSTGRDGPILSHYNREQKTYSIKTIRLATCSSSIFSYLNTLKRLISVICMSVSK